MGKKNKSKQNTSSVSTVTTQVTDTSETPNEEKSEAPEFAIGDKKLQRQREKLEREEEERKKWEEKAKQEKINTTKKKTKKSATRAQKRSEPSPEPKAKVENSSGDWNVESKTEEDISFQCNTQQNVIDETKKDLTSHSDQEDWGTSYQESPSKVLPNRWSNTPTQSKRSWGHRPDSYQNPNSSLDSNWKENDAFNNRQYDQKKPYNQRDNRNFSKGDNYNREGNYGSKQRLSEPNYSNYDKRSSYYNNWGSSSNSRFDGKNDDEFQAFLDLTGKRPAINYGKLIEKRGDLFTASEDYSLAHCVAEDMSMGAGIAKTFRSQFRQVGFLLNQRQKTGGLAVLQDKTRFIYYLITKEVSRGKPTLYTLWLSLLKLKQHIQEHDVSKLAIPQIGCGLDRLDWQIVQQMLEHIFKDVDIQIVVYIWDETNKSLFKQQTLWHYSIKRKSANMELEQRKKIKYDLFVTPEGSFSFENESVEEPTPQKLLKKCSVNHVQKELIEIETQTGLLYFGTVDGFESDAIKSLSTKYNLNSYKRLKTLGAVINVIEKNEYIYGLIIKESNNDEADFVEIEKALGSLRKTLKKDKTDYIGFQAFIDQNDKLLLDKIIALMQYIFLDVSIWVCWPEAIKDQCPQQSRTY